MNRIQKLVIHLLLLTLLTTACGSVSSPRNSTDNNDSSGQNLITGDGSEPGADEDILLLEALNVTPSILAAGETLQISIQQSIDGEVIISKSGEKVLTQPFSGSSGAGNLSEDLTDGV